MFLRRIKIESKLLANKLLVVKLALAHAFRQDQPDILPSIIGIEDARAVSCPVRDTDPAHVEGLPSFLLEKIVNSRGYCHYLCLSHRFHA